MKSVTDYELFEYYSHSLSAWINKNISKPNELEIKAILSLWGDITWKELVKRVQTEGSAWIVWWNDGVRNYADNDIGHNHE